MKKWKIVNQESEFGVQETDEKIISILLDNRGFKKRSEIENFLNPEIAEVTLHSSGVDEKAFEKFRKRIDTAVLHKEKIIVYGDYDVDGICASAILWETLYAKTKQALPYIPDRIDEGYGLSTTGIDNILKEHPDVKIIITVDNGIVAFDAVTYAKKKGIEVIVTDHHVMGEKLPEAFCILHTTSLCGAGIAWIIAHELRFESQQMIEEKLELATLATIADLVPLTHNNRAIVKEGLELLKKTTRIGISELFQNAGIEKENINVYTIGHAIAPRINATGRIQSAMNALRLLCTKDREKAKMLSEMLGNVNRERQDLTEGSVTHAKLLAMQNDYSTRITVVADESYNQGVIGLIASQLVESYYRPSFAIAKGEKISKGSARSIKGVNIIELLRSVSSTLLEAGGHPMAAGFSVETHRIEEFTQALSQKAETIVTDEILERFVTIDLEILFSVITKSLHAEISKLEPFGMGNPEPVFATKNVTVDEVRKIGKAQNHLKMKLSKDGITFDAVGFGMAEKVEIDTGDTIDIAYTIDENVWNGKVSLQLKLRDIKKPN